MAELAELLEGQVGLVDVIESLRHARRRDQELAEDLASLSGSSVLLHTLIEAAAERAKRYLQVAART